MSQMIAIFAPLLAFMLIPVWIPVAAVIGGTLVDLFGGTRRDPVAERVERLKASHRDTRPALAETDRGALREGRAHLTPGH